jgi:hypothetical protein
MKKSTLAEKVAFALLTSMAAALLLTALVAHLKDSASSSDFMGFYTAGNILKQSLRSRLYEYGLQLSFQQRLFGRTVPINVYDHPPFEALLFLPLAYLPYSVAHISWDLLNLLVLAWSLYQLKPYVINLDTESRLVLAAVMAFPLISTLREGQDAILLFCAYVMGFVALKKNKEFTAGCALGAGLFRFQFVLPFLVVFLLRKRWRLILGVTTVGAILAVVSFALVGWAGLQGYIRLLFAIGKRRAFPTLVPAMPNVRGFVNVVLGDRVGDWYVSSLVVLISLALLGWTVRKWSRPAWNPTGSSFNLLFSFNVVVTIMLSYHSLIHSLLLLTLPALLLLDYCAAIYSAGMSRWRPILPLILFILMTTYLLTAGGNRFGFLFATILWFAACISAEISRCEEIGG